MGKAAAWQAAALRQLFSPLCWQAQLKKGWHHRVLHSYVCLLLGQERGSRGASWLLILTPTPPNRGSVVWCRNPTESTLFSSVLESK